MLNWLVKRFVKNAEDVQNANVRTAYGMLTSVIGIICNVLLFGMKFVVGSVIGSISVTADAFNNLSDAASGVVGFVGAKLANRPADEEHPFGHGRYEYLAALVVAFLVFEVGISCLKSSIEKIAHPSALRFQWVPVLILAASILVKVWLVFINRRLGKRISSGVMKATAADALGDVMITSATVISILVAYATGWAIDGYMGLIVSLAVLYAAIGIVRETLEPLLGGKVSEELAEQIENLVLSYDSLVVGTHDLIVHNYGPTQIFASVHAEVPKDRDIDEIHEVVDAIEREAKNRYGIELVIHMDPIEVNDELVLQTKEKLKVLVSTLDGALSIHDFRMVNGEEQINLIFDLVVPYSYSITQKGDLIREIRRRMQEIDGRYQCVIQVEHKY